MKNGFEWPTLVVLAITYAVWGLATTGLAEMSLTAAVLLTGIAIAQFSSLQHEMITATRSAGRG